MTYLYRCVNGHETEYRAKITEDLPDGIMCAECGSWMKRIPTAGYFTLKGDGWAKTGYDKGKKK